MKQICVTCQRFPMANDSLIGIHWYCLVANSIPFHMHILHELYRLFSLYLAVWSRCLCQHQGDIVGTSPLGLARPKQSNND